MLARGMPLRLALAACVGWRAGGAAGGDDPQSVLHAYARLLEEGRADDAYRAAVGRGAPRNLARGLPAHGEGRPGGRTRDRPRARAADAPPVVTATVTSPSGQELHLVLEDGGWRVDASTIDLYAQDTPRHAVAGLHPRGRAQALRHRDALRPRRAQARGSTRRSSRPRGKGTRRRRSSRCVAGLKQALPSATIEETGERATMPYGAGTMQLVREHGLWKIENFD